MSAPVVLVVGAGPGVSGSLARLYAAQGYRVGLVGVDEDALTQLAASIGPAGDPDDPIAADSVRWTVTDVTDVDAAATAIRGLAESFDRVDVLHFNPSAYRAKDPLHLEVDELLADVALGVGALLTSVRAARPFMSRGGRVTATGSMAADKPSHEAASLGVQKAGLRNLVRSLDATLAPDGVRAVSVTVRGALSREGTFTPDRVAEALHAAAHQDEADWHSEVGYPS